MPPGVFKFQLIYTLFWALKQDIDQSQTLVENEQMWSHLENLSFGIILLCSKNSQLATSRLFGFFSEKYTIFGKMWQVQAQKLWCIWWGTAPNDVSNAFVYDAGTMHDCVCPTNVHQHSSWKREITFTKLHLVFCWFLLAWLFLFCCGKMSTKSYFAIKAMHQPWDPWDLGTRDWSINPAAN